MKITKEMNELAPLFVGATFSVPITFEELELIFSSFSVAGMAAVCGGEDVDEIIKIMETIKSKYTAAMQKYLDATTSSQRKS